ncbi:protein CROWDED NUCLEI 1 isoform X2 [Beta vulgaris subsp. vulgaris]|uniref:protein CROWDED NUCLEI 1 isoform X2 n=1 Tax=Beta vulgaris subsp. vulgaris TaxID=3555 RepID=UPI0020372017|nr:protein CROWDED NUCLEI 1 isoform X2 [Beta vulgaris subsp. vulgaris]
MFTPQNKVFSAWSLSPRRENKKTPVTNSNSNVRISENGGVVAEDGNDLEDLDGKVAKLENELFEYQYNMGLLLIEKKEWSSKFDDLQQALAEQKDALKREQSAHLMAISDLEKREENLRKGLGVEKQCVRDLEKALREMRSEYAEIKFTADSKLAEANSLAANIEEKSLEVEAKLRAADAKFAEASRKASEIERKMQDIEGRETALRRERLSFNSEKDTHDATVSKQREDLLEWERKLQEGEERLCEARRILNQREERANEVDKGFKQKEFELAEVQKKMDKANMDLKKKEEDISQRLASLIIKEKEFDAMKKRIEAKEKELHAREEHLTDREKNELQKLLNDHKVQLDAKKQEFDLEMDQKRRSVDEELKSKVVELEKKEVQIRHAEEKIAKREQALDKKLEKFKEKENDFESKSKALKEREKGIKEENKQLEKEKKQILGDTEHLLKLKEELENIKIANEKQLLRIQEEKEELRVTEEEKSEHSRLQSELRREIDECRSQKEVLLKEAAELKQERMSFEQEWESLDEKKAEIERELKKLTEEKEKWEKWRHLEEERLRNESLDSQKKIESEVKAFELEKDSFAAHMEYQKSLLSEREQTERRKMIDDLEQQRRDLEMEMRKVLEEKERDLSERERSFEEEKEKEQNNINYLRETAERGIEHMKEEQRRISKQTEEVAASKKDLEERRLEIQKDVDELFALSGKLKDQREQLVKERERFIAFVQKFKSSEQFGEMTREFMLSDLQFLQDMEKREIAPLPKLAEDYMRYSFKENVYQSEIQNDERSPAPGNESSTPGKSVSWLRKCTEKILKFSPIKREAAAGENLVEEGSPVDQDANAGSGSDRHNIVEEVPELSFRLVSDSLDVQAPVDQDPSVGAQGNTNNGKEPELSQNSDLNGQHRAARRERLRVSRTRSVKAVIEDAKDIVGDSVELSGSEHPNGDAEDSIHMDDDSRDVSSLADKENRIKGRKRGRVHTSQTTVSEQDDGVSEGRSDSVAAGGPRTRRRKVAAGAQVPAEKRYNLRRPRNVVTGATVKTSSDTRKDKVNITSKPEPSHSAVASDNGTSINLMQAQTEEANTYTTPVPKRRTESIVQSEEVNGTPDQHGDYGDEEYSVAEEEEEDDDEEEAVHPGEASIGKKLWKFLTT